MIEQNEKIQLALQLENRAGVDNPTVAELQELSQQVSWYNQNIGDHSLSLMGLLDILEAEISDTVRLKSIYFDRQEKEVLLSLESLSEEDLLDDFENLQTVFAPQPVELDRQIALDAEDGRRVQFDLRVGS